MGCFQSRTVALQFLLLWLFISIIKQFLFSFLVVFSKLVMIARNIARNRNLFSHLLLQYFYILKQITCKLCFVIPILTLTTQHVNISNRVQRFNAHTNPYNLVFFFFLSTSFLLFFSLFLIAFLKKGLQVLVKCSCNFTLFKYTSSHIFKLQNNNNNICSYQQYVY